MGTVYVVNVMINSWYWYGNPYVQLVSYSGVHYYIMSWTTSSNLLIHGI